MNNHLQLTAQIDLAAGDASKPATIAILAYTGALMNVPGVGPAVVDLAGLTLPDSVPLLVDHDATLKGIVGAGTPRIERNQLLITGTLARGTPAADQLIALAKSGVSFQASVGVEVRQRSSTKSATANGRVFNEPTFFTLVSSGVLREISILPLGADSQTSVQIAATAARKTNMTEITTTPDPVQAERNRLKAFCEISAKAEYATAGNVAATLQAKAIDEGWTPEHFELELLRAARPQASFIPTAPRFDAGYDPRKLLTAGIAIHAGRADLAVKAYGEHIAERAADLRCHSLLDLCAAALRLAYRDVPRDRSEMIRAAFSTSSLPTALGDYANKVSAQAFAETPQTWRAICRRVPVNNFREHKIVRVLLVGNYTDVPNGGELKHGSRAEDVVTAQASTKGMILGISRQDVINDDLGTFNDTNVALALAAARSMNDSFAETLLNNEGSFFDAGNGNYLEGATPGSNDSRLNTEGLTRAYTSMQKRTDSAGRIVDLRPTILLVPPELEQVADQLLRSAEVARYVTTNVDNAQTGNPFYQALTRVTEPRLSASGYAGYSATAWYLFAAPSAGAVNVALLNGKDTPTIEQDNAPFNQLGIMFRGYHDFGFSLGETVAATKSKGAAGT